ncbi:MAG: AI-2E family transporter [Planctomycetes bacterium]|nr:AI-2E family transporter [Planctomycetota bacterium]
MSDSSLGWTPEQRARIFRKLAIWAVFFGVLYLLRGFFPLVFFTFVFAYAAEHALLAMQARFTRAPRGLLVAAVFLGSLAALGGIGALVVPRIRDEVETFRKNIPTYERAVRSSFEELRGDHPEAADALVGLLNEIESLPQRVLGGEGTSRPAGADSHGGAPAIKDLSQVFSVGIGVVGAVLSGLATLALSLVFAFLIVVDLPNLRAEVAALERSRVGWLYREVRATIVELGDSLGHILEAQALIAVVNTVLTVAGLWFLGVPSVLLLGVVVFFCSFVPVVGTFLSLVPIALLALTEGGLVLVLKTAAWIAVIHAFEAYVLEPRIFGRHFHLNPVFVLVILVVGHKLAGVWGLLLGIPVAYTLLRPIESRSGAAPAKS